jgi:hypothetical protein
MIHHTVYSKNLGLKVLNKRVRESIGYPSNPRSDGHTALRLCRRMNTKSKTIAPAIHPSGGPGLIAKVIQPSASSFSRLRFCAFL